MAHCKIIKYNFRTRSKNVNFRTLNILLAEKRKAALLGKDNYPSIDKHYKVAGYKWYDIWMIDCLMREHFFTLLRDSTAQTPRFSCLHRSWCVGKVSKELWSRITLKVNLGIYTKKTKEIQLLMNLRLPFQRSVQYERSWKLMHIVRFTHNAAQCVANFLWYHPILLWHLCIFFTEKSQ